MYEAGILFYFLISCISNSYSFVFLYIGFLAINCLIAVAARVYHELYMTLHNKNFNIQDIHQINLFWMIVEARVWFRKKNSKYDYSIYISIHLIEADLIRDIYGLARVNNSYTAYKHQSTWRSEDESSDLSITNRLEKNL
ncbi:hypothetical protein ACJX0J_022863, partial [Zea mays]